MEIRLNKFLSEAGVCSRRAADRLIEEGKVEIDGLAAKPGQKVTEHTLVTVEGCPVKKQEQEVLLAFYKPRGVTCTTDKRWGDRTVDDVLNYPARVFSIGRLDKESEGLLLMTNQGDLMNKIMRPGNYHEKEYEVTVDHPITEKFLKKMSSGTIPVLETRARPCKVEALGKNCFRIILTQGLNRQIRRMCQYCGYQVTELKRLRVMNIQLGSMKPGEYRDITKKEQAELLAMLKGSVNNSSYGTKKDRGNRRHE